MADKEVSMELHAVCVCVCVGGWGAGCGLCAEVSGQVGVCMHVQTCVWMCRK